jgi:hypothetical protein
MNVGRERRGWATYFDTGDGFRTWCAVEISLEPNLLLYATSGRRPPKAFSGGIGTTPPGRDGDGCNDSP